MKSYESDKIADEVLRLGIHSKEEVEEFKNNNGGLVNAFLLVKIIGNCRFCSRLLKRIVKENKSVKREDLCPVCRLRWHQ